MFLGSLSSALLQYTNIGVRYLPSSPGGPGVALNTLLYTFIGTSSRLQRVRGQRSSPPRAPPPSTAKGQLMQFSSLGFRPNQYLLSRAFF